MNMPKEKVSVPKGEYCVPATYPSCPFPAGGQRVRAAPVVSDEKPSQRKGPSYLASYHDPVTSLPLKAPPPLLLSSCLGIANS